MTRKQIVERWKNPDFLLGKNTAIKMVFVDKEMHRPEDLQGIIVGTEGAVEDLFFANLNRVKLSEINFGYSEFACFFAEGVFENINFSYSKFQMCRFFGSNFLNCNFFKSSIKNPTLDDAKFENCEFESAKIFGGILSGSGGKRVTFKKCNFKKFLFQNISLRGCKFIDCNFEDVLFQKCITIGTSFHGFQPPDSVFIDCNQL